MANRTAATAGGGGHPDIDFDAAASGPVGVAVEPKVCEFCGRQFFRAVRAEVKYCRGCQRTLKIHLVGPGAGTR